MVKAKRAMRQQLDDLKIKLESTWTTAKDELAAVARTTPEVMEAVQDERKIAKNRVVAIDKVLGKPEDLQEYIASFDVSMGCPMKVTLGDAPPCRQYAELVTLQLLYDHSATLDTAETKEEMESIKKFIGDKKKPIMGLGT